MPAALETSKRKFHALLDTLTSTALDTTSLHSTSSDGSPSSKRSRITLRAVPSRHNETLGLPSTTATTSAVRKSVARRGLASNAAPSASAAPTPPRNPPNYTPWSHDTFLTRLRTFADLRRWTSKPDAVNEVAWAKRGWVCDGVNTVACRGGCEARVVVALRPPRRNEAGEEIEGSEDYSVEVEPVLVQRYEGIVVTGHRDECLWRGAGCKDDIYRLPIARPAIWRPQLKERYRSFAGVKNLPGRERLDGAEGDEVELANILGTRFFEDEIVQDPAPNGELQEGVASTVAAEERQAINQAAFKFALYGWKGTDEGSGNTMARCDACFRRIGLWLYDSATQNTSPDSNDQHERGHEHELMKLDLINNHREYCPWIDSKSQQMTGSFEGLAAWQILQRVIRNSAPTKTTVSQQMLEQGATDTGELDARARTPAGDAEKADKVRFARFKELTKAMSFKNLRRKDA